MVQVYLGLGTNLGDRLANLRAAREALPPAVTVQRASPIYETDPWGYTDQPAFLNQVLEAQTGLSPLDLLTQIKQIEASLGRAPTFRYGPRLIDLDILLYESQEINLPDLVIPHPRLAERAFVLVPLADLAPDLVVPGLELAIRDLLARVDKEGIQRLDQESLS